MTEHRAFRPPYRLLAVAASLAVHLGAAAFALNGRAPEEQLAGAGARASVQIGQAFASSIAAGAQAGGGAVPPRQSPTQTAATTEPTQAVTPAPPQTTAQAVSPAIQPVVKPSAAQAAQTAMARPTEAKPVAATPARAAESQATTQTPAVPRPIARPPEITRIAAATPTTKKPERKQAQKQVEPKRRDTAARTARAKSAPGAGGKGRQTVQKGGSRGGAKTREAGNAASSNYPGLVRRKLGRSLRYPRSARRKGLTGEVTVGFTVQSSGVATGVRVVRSSGSPILDRAALETVGRAAPFPRIPANAGKTRWRFTIPLTFR
ncbi:energy transducer TonB [Stappia indica]|uniref:energy transducer TonB n=1 Tax=Stappia indica TaxID=538381 RepID=UPI001CD3B3B4|nr:energy transducer TonB [Stappia indica]MCA1300538.1 TonB family protein [Stappia indica]